MTSIVNTISYEAAKSRISRTSYALLYKIEEINLHKMSVEDDIDSLLEECYEARFFDEECEVRLFRECVDDDSSSWSGAYIIEEPVSLPCVSQDKMFSLAKHYQQPGRKKVTVRQYLLPDEDGQMCVQATRLVRIEG